MLSCNVSRLQMSCLHRLSPHSGRCRVAASAGSYGAIPSRVFASFGKRQEFAYVDHNIGGACNWRFRSEEHTSELQSLMSTSYAVFCLIKKIKITKEHQ